MSESGLEKMDVDHLNSFGNLCLISHSKNSRLSNFSPKAKADHYRSGAIDSIKQHLMTRVEQWDKESIDNHYKAMKTELETKLTQQSLNQVAQIQV